MPKKSCNLINIRDHHRDVKMKQNIQTIFQEIMDSDKSEETDEDIMDATISASESTNTNVTAESNIRYGKKQQCQRCGIMDHWYKDAGLDNL